MFKRLRRLVLLPVFMIATVPLATLPTGTAQEVQAQEDPITTVEAFVDALNDGDLAAAMDLVADDAVITLIDSHGSQAGFGKPAFEGAVAQGADVNRQAELTGLATRSDAATGIAEVTGVAEITDDECEDRYLQPFTFTLNESNLITRADFTHDETDPQTVACLESLEPPPSEPPPGVPTIDMAAQSGSNQTGVAFVEEDGGMAIAGIFIAAGPQGVLQPAHVHTGTCEAPGPIVQPLASVVNGSSSSFISAFPETDPGLGLIVNVHKSEAEPNVYVSCGVLQAASAPASTPTTSAPAPTPTTSSGVAAPDTGTGSSGPSARTGLGTFAIVAAFFTLLGMVAIAAGILYQRQAGTRTRRQSSQ